MNQDTAAPTRKVSAAMVGGALATIIAWIVNVVWSIDVPAEVQVALAVVITCVAAYVVKDNAPEVGV